MEENAGSLGGGGGAMDGEGTPPPPSPLYALRFGNELTILRLLRFVGSPGGVAFDNVGVVAIDNSVFR